MIRALFLFVLGTILGKYIGLWRSHQTHSFTRAFWWVFLLVLAFILPVLFLKTLMKYGLISGEICTQTGILLPAFLTSLALWAFWNCHCCKQQTRCTKHQSTQETSTTQDNNSKDPITATQNIYNDTAPDDLTKIEGIGPKIQQVLYDNGISTFKALSQVESQHILSLLRAAGPQFAQHDPTTWPMQASLAAAGRRDKLKTRQDNLDGGKMTS